MSQKGYKQNLDKGYVFHFNYCFWPILLNYNLSKNVTIHSGVKLSCLFSTNIEQGIKTIYKISYGQVDYVFNIL